MLNNKKLLSSTVLYAIGEVVPRALALLLLPILTTYLSTRDYGISSYTTSVMTFVFVIASLSLNTYLLKQYYSLDSLEDRKNLVGSIFYFLLIFNVGLILLQYLIFPKLIRVFNINIPFFPYFWLAIINNFFDVIAIIPLVLFRVQENAKGFLIVSLSRTILQYLLVLILVVHFKLGLEGSYYGRLFANVPFVFIFFYYIYKNGNFKIDKTIIRNALRFSIPLLPGSISYILISLSDRVILERYISLSQLGIYSVAFTLALTLNVVIQAVYKTIEPILFKEYNSPEFNKVNLTLYKAYLSLLFIAGFAAALFSKEIFLIATSSGFSSGYKLVPLLIISVLISGVNLYIDMLLIANHKQKVVSYTTVLSGIISICINLLLIPIYGFYGAIIASITSFLVVNIICQRLVFIQKKYYVEQFLLISAIAMLPYLYDYLIISPSIFFNILIKSFIFFGFTFFTLKLFNINPLIFLKRKVVS